MTTDTHTPIGQIPSFELTKSLDAFVRQAYFRRSRQMPANIAEMVECLKGDLLRHFPDCPIGTVDDAITTSTLFDNDKPVSVAFFFEAVKKKWWQPKSNIHGWDGDTYRRQDTEADTIALLDTCADIVRRQESADKDPDAPTRSTIIELPAFNPRRTFEYLKMRGQLSEGAAEHFTPDAILKVNTDRMKTHHHRLTKEEAKVNPDVRAMAMRLACLSWLKACIAKGRNPSDILTPLVDQATYAAHRRTTP